MNQCLTCVVPEVAWRTVCFLNQARVNITGTFLILERENNLDRDLLISTTNAPDRAILRNGVRLLNGILVLLIVAFCFFASSICITVILAAFLAILADPAVRTLERLRIPRFFGASLIVLAGVAACGLLSYESYDKLADFSDEFPSYASRIAD